MHCFMHEDFFQKAVLFQDFPFFGVDRYRAVARRKPIAAALVHDHRPYTGAHHIGESAYCLCILVGLFLGVLDRLEFGVYADFNHDSVRVRCRKKKDSIVSITSHSSVVNFASDLALVLYRIEYRWIRSGYEALADGWSVVKWGSQTTVSRLRQCPGTDHDKNQTYCPKPRLVANRFALGVVRWLSSVCALGSDVGSILCRRRLKKLNGDCHEFHRRWPATGQQDLPQPPDLRAVT